MGIPGSRLQFEAIGTIWEIELYEAINSAALAELERAVMARIGAFDHHYSRFRSDSLVTRMSRQTGQYDLPPDARPMLDLYHELYRLTSGTMTPLIGQVLSDAGYDADYSLKPGSLTAPPSWDEALHYTAASLTIRQPVLLDFGAAGKGYLVDLVAGIIEAQGVTAYCVDAGGDMRYRRPGGPALTVGLEHPGDARQVIGVAGLQQASLCGSAGNRRAWDRFHHIIDPHRLASPTHLAAVWVVADSTMVADALTTALFFASAQILSQHYQFEYALVYDDYALEHSANFPGEFFISAQEAPA